GRAGQAPPPAAGGHHLDVGQQAAALLLAEGVEDVGRAPVQAGPLGMAFGALVEADEHIPVWLGHSLASLGSRLPPRLHLPAAAVRPGDDLQEVAARVLPVDAAAAVVGVDLPGPPPAR